MEAESITLKWSEYQDLVKLYQLAARYQELYDGATKAHEDLIKFLRTKTETISIESSDG
jgi:hypothetical protein